jgi:uncharacterized delta-60 repeat protein
VRHAWMLASLVAGSVAAACTTANKVSSDKEAGVKVTLSGEVVRLLKGTSTTVTATVERLGPVRGAVSIDPVDLPAGVTIPHTTVPAGSDTALLTVNATDIARHGGPIPIKLRAPAEDGSRAVSEIPASLVVAGVPGEPDASFNQSGSIAQKLAGFDQEHFNELTLLADGKVLVAGFGDSPSTGRKAFLARLTPTGEVDASFQRGVPPYDTDASYATEYTQAARARARIRPLNDGRILAVGRAWGGGDLPTRDVFVRRFNADGRPDEAFGDSGRIAYPYPVYTVLRSDGYVVFIPGDDTIRAYTVDGLPDSSFGADGVIEGITGLDQPVGITCGQADTQGRVWLGSSKDYGASNHYSSVNIELTRRAANGVLDDGFGLGGRASVNLQLDKVLVDTDVVSDAATVVDVHHFGFEGSKALVCGTYGYWRYEKSAQQAWVKTGETVNGYIARLNDDGTLDESFGNGGFIRRGSFAQRSLCRRVLQLTSGKVLALFVESGDVLVAYNANGSVDTTFRPDATAPMAVPPFPEMVEDPIAGRVYIGARRDGLVELMRLWL